ncbi:MAG: hypothetical protein AAF530_21155 [Pseudomonadota bacterium]
MTPKSKDRLDRALSSIAAVTTFGFFMTVVTMGWYQTFAAMAQ